MNPRPAKQARSTTYPAHTSFDTQVERGTRPIVLYLRLSKVHADAGADSIERQRLDLRRKLAADGGWTVTAEYVDNDSASSSAARTRSGWVALNRAIKAGEVQAVAFWKLDRTNRVASKTLEWIADCQEHNVTLVSHEDASDELNKASAGGKLLTGIKALLAEVETDTMSARQLAAKRHAAEAGFNHGGMIPFGYVKGPQETDTHGRTGTRLQPHPIEFPALVDGVRLVLDGWSLNAVARHWREVYGIVTAAGAALPVGNVGRYLKSPRLMGYRMRQVPEHERGVKVNLLDYIARDSDGSPVISQQPVCDRVTWMRLQKAISEGHTGTRSDWGTHPWLLTKVMMCTCGNPLYGALRKHGERRNLQYCCTANRRRGPGTCASGVSISAEPAESFVVGWLFVYLSPERLARAERRLASDTASPVGRLVQELDEARTALKVLLTSQNSPAYKGSRVSILLGMIETQSDRIDALQSQIDVLSAPLRLVSGDALETDWPKMSLEQRRSLVRRVIQRIDVKPGRGLVADRLKIKHRT